MQRQVIQTTFRQTSIADRTQAIDSRGQGHRTTVQAREEVLQLRCICLKIREVGTEIGIVDIRHADGRHVSFQYRLTVITQGDGLESQRVQGSGNGSIEGDRPVETCHTRHKQRDVGRYQTSLVESESHLDIMCRTINIQVTSREEHLYTTHVQTRMRQAGSKGRHGHDGVVNDQVRLNGLQVKAVVTAFAGHRQGDIVDLRVQRFGTEVTQVHIRMVQMGIKRLIPHTEVLKTDVTHREDAAGQVMLLFLFLGRNEERIVPRAVSALIDVRHHILHPHSGERYLVTEEGDRAEGGIELTGI